MSQYPGAPRRPRIALRQHASACRRACAVLVVFLATASVSIGSAAEPPAPDDLELKLNTWYGEASRLAPGEWGVAVADEHGNILWSIRPDQPLIPASAVKLFTTGFARTVLGGSARRTTRVLGRGYVDPTTGRWVGTWALELNGDPSLERGTGDGPRLAYLAEQLAAMGVRQVTGPLDVRSANGPAGAEYPAAWSSRHAGRLFAPLIGPLTVHENVVRFTVRPGGAVGRRAFISSVSPAGIERLVAIKATTSTGRRSRLRVRPSPGGGWVVTGRIGVRSRGRSISVPAADPRLVLDAAWEAALAQVGIEWLRSEDTAAPDVPNGRILAEVFSPSLDSIATDVNRRSSNIGAELMLQWAAGDEFGPELLTQHVQFVTGSLSGVHLVDGSGLSNHARVAPRIFVSYMAELPRTEGGRNFPLLLPANGTGTLKPLDGDLPAQGVFRAKTGTLRNVSTVVGYLGHPDGVLLLSLMYNGSRPSSARRAQWRLVRELGADGIVVPSVWEEEPETPRFGGQGDGWTLRRLDIR